MADVGSVGVGFRQRAGGSSFGSVRHPSSLVSSTTDLERPRRIMFCSRFPEKVLMTRHKLDKERMIRQIPLHKSRRESEIERSLNIGVVDIVYPPPPGRSALRCRYRAISATGRHCSGSTSLVTTITMRSNRADRTPCDSCPPARNSTPATSTSTLRARPEA